MPSTLAEACHKSLRAGRRNLPAMLALEGAMGAVVALYYGCAAAGPFFARLAAWQHAGGFLAASVSSAFAGGFLSEFSAVYFLDGGRWTRAHLENMAFKLALFFSSGGLVYEFYHLQAFWFGDGVAWSIILPKILVDQFGYTVFWATPYQTLLTRWHALGFSGRKLWGELKSDLITRRMLPVLITNWMFWIPGVCLIYALPLNLQMPLAIFATAIWGLLLTAAVREPHPLPTATVEDLLPTTD